MPQNTNVKKGFKLKKKTLTTDVWSELDGRKLHPPFGSDEPPLSFGQGWVKNFLGLAQDILGWLNIFFGLAQETFLACSIFFWPCLRDILWLAQFFFELAQYFVWAASRYRVFFLQVRPKK